MPLKEFLRRLFSVVIALTLLTGPFARAATVVGPGKDTGTLLISVEPSEASLVEASRLLLFEEKESGKLFRGTVLRVGGTKAVIGLTAPVEIESGALLIVQPPFKNDALSPQLLWESLLHQRRRSSIGLHLGALQRVLAPQNEDRTTYRGYAFGLNPEYTKPGGGAVIGTHAHSNILRQTAEGTAFPSSLTLLGFEPYSMFDIASAFAVGLGMKYWRIRHSVDSANTITQYDYSMTLFDLNFVLHGYSGEIGLSYQTGSKVGAATTSTSTGASTGSRFLIEPPKVAAMGRWSLGGGLFASLLYGTVLASETLYENSDLIKSTTRSERTFYGIGTEIMTTGASKWELAVRRLDPLSLQEGGLPLYAAVYSGSLIWTSHWNRVVDTTIAMSALNGSKLYHYDSVSEDQSFETTQYKVEFGATWTLSSKD